MLDKNGPCVFFENVPIFVPFSGRGTYCIAGNFVGAKLAEIDHNSLI